MRDKEIKQVLSETELPIAYHHFQEKRAPSPPFLVYLYPQSNNFSADGIVYQGVAVLNVELYTDKKDLESEQKVECVLKKHGFFYEKSEVYIESERLYEVLYEMEVIINE